jgi:hypothetical protein
VEATKSSQKRLKKGMLFYWCAVPVPISRLNSRLGAGPLKAHQDVKSRFWSSCPDFLKFWLRVWTFHRKRVRRPLQISETLSAFGDLSSWWAFRGPLGAHVKICGIPVPSYRAMSHGRHCSGSCTSQLLYYSSPRVSRSKLVAGQALGTNKKFRPTNSLHHIGLHQDSLTAPFPLARSHAQRSTIIFHLR